MVAEVAHLTEESERMLVAALADWFSAKVTELANQRKLHISAIKDDFATRTELEIMTESTN